jgi:Family of unknown function (DUF6011)
MTRTPVPSEFQDRQTASPNSIRYCLDLLEQKDLFSNNQWSDRYGAMDQEEYAEVLAKLREEIPTWSQQKVSKTIDWLLRLNYGRATTVRDAVADFQNNPFNHDLPTPAQLPAGRYAVESDEGELRFYHLWRGTRKPDYFKLYVQHGPDSSEVPFRSAKTILHKIVAAGPFEAATRYGREIGRCSKCHTRLTNTLSRELGIGPVCGGRYFEDDPDAWKARKKRAREAIVARGEDPDAEV